MSLTLPERLRKQLDANGVLWHCEHCQGRLRIPDSVTKSENQAFWTGRTSGEGLIIQHVLELELIDQRSISAIVRLRQREQIHIDLTRVDELSSMGELGS